MATENPTKEQFLKALNEKGINNLEDLLDAIMPETGGFVHAEDDSQEGWEGPPAAAISKFFGFGFALDVGTRPPREDTIPGIR